MTIFPIKSGVPIRNTLEASNNPSESMEYEPATRFSHSSWRYHPHTHSFLGCLRRVTPVIRRYKHDTEPRVVKESYKTALYLGPWSVLYRLSECIETARLFVHLQRDVSPSIMGKWSMMEKSDAPQIRIEDTLFLSKMTRTRE